MVKKILLNFLKKKNHKNKVLKIYKKIFKTSNVNVIFTHKNNVYVVFKKKEKIYRKFAINKSGVQKIINDYKGLNWYCLRNKISSKKILLQFKKKTKNIAFIDTKEIRGIKVKTWISLNKNYKYVLPIFNHYKKIFIKKKLHKIHGDLTLDNIFFEKKSIFFIDWEFFGTKKKLWGYDLVYLVLSSISLPYIANKVYSKADEKIFLQLWKKLKTMKINKELLNDPFNFFKQEIKTDILLKKSFNISKEKFFPFLTPIKFQNRILQSIKKL